MLEQEVLQKCITTSIEVRRHILDMTYGTGNTGAHLGGSLSAVELLSCLYIGVLHYRAYEPGWEGRDRVILSKGHAAMALYAVMAEAGIIDVDQLSDFKKDGSLLGAHPSLNGLCGIEFASGSLGQGLSLGVGSCLGLIRKSNCKSRVFVILGDGECDEGSVWEAAASAAHFNLSQLVAIVDANQMQYDGNTNEIMDMSPLAEKWRAFGWDVAEIDGHNVKEVLSAYKHHSNRPYVIIANTIKGKGISFIENDYRYHNARLSRQLYEEALAELNRV